MTEQTIDSRQKDSPLTALLIIGGLLAGASIIPAAHYIYSLAVGTPSLTETMTDPGVAFMCFPFEVLGILTGYELASKYEERK